MAFKYRGVEGLQITIPLAEYQELHEAKEKLAKLEKMKKAPAKKKDEKSDS